MKKTNTKRTLILSALSLLLCFSMLIGTTFAWFTDEVKSANNIIVSGNLDVELEYWNGKTWVDVSGADDILTNNLWEPGVTEVVYLRVANAGTLALKYQFGINIVDEKPGTRVNAKGEDEQFSLSDYIQFGVAKIEANAETKVPATYATREDAIAAVKADNAEAKSDKISKGFTKAASMTAGEEFYLALVVYMPTEVGNEANYKTGTTAPQIDLGINIFATQLANEDDSFGSDYDEDAWHNSMKVYTADDLQAAVSNGQDVVLMNDIDLAESLVIPVPQTKLSTKAADDGVIVIDLNGKTIAGIGRNDEGKVHTVINNGNLHLKNGTVKTVGNDGGSAIYNAEGATLVLEGVTALGAPQASNVYPVPAYPSYAINNYGDLIVNGATVKSYHGAIATGGNGTAVINDVTIDVGMGNSTGITSYAIYAFENGQVTINGGNFAFTKQEVYVNGGNMFCELGSKPIVINGGNFVGGGFSQGDGREYVIKGGTFSFDTTKYVADGFKAVETPNGWMVIAADSNYVADGVLVSTDGNTYYIFNRAGYEWVETQTDNFFGNKTIALTADIDFGGDTIPSIGFWNSHPTFDGQGHTLSNFDIAQTGLNSSSGLFAGTFNVKNLNVDNASVKGTYADVISGWMYGNVDNCVVKNSTVNNTYWQGGGLVGQYNSGDVTNCTVENCTISGGAAVGGLIGILNEASGERKVENCAVKNCTIIMDGGFGSIYDDMFGAAIGLINIENSKVFFNNCTLEGNTVKNVETNVICGMSDSSTKITVDGVILVTSTEELIAAIKDAPVGSETVILMDDAIYTGDIAITVEAFGKSGGDVVIKAMEGATPVISGTVTFGYRDQGVGAAMYNANITFEGITFDQAIANTHSLDVQDVKSLTFKNCTIIGDGECGVVSSRGNATGTSKFVGCTFVNAGVQLLGNFATGLVIDDCIFNESRVNVQAGNGVTVQNCEFNATLTDTNVGDSFYLIRSNSTPITVKNCEIKVDSKVTGVATAQAKWYLLANRGTTNWTVENVAVTLTDAALAQTELKVTACTSTGVINATNLTVNGVAK